MVGPSVVGVGSVVVVLSPVNNVVVVSGGGGAVVVVVDWASRVGSSRNSEPRGAR